MSVDERYRAVVELLNTQHADDPGFSAQVCAQVDGHTVVDAAVGDDLRPDSLVCVFSVSKGLTGICIAILIERGLLDPTAPVADYWPEFAAAGKAAVTVAEALSHQAGLPFLPPVSQEEFLSDELAAPMLAASRPVWRPGSMFGYHPVTAGVIAGALVRRVSGMSVADFWESEVRGVNGLEAWFVLPQELEARVTPVRFPDLPALPPGADQITDRIAEPLLGVPGIAVVANTRAGHIAGMPAASAVASARGIAGAYGAALWGGLISDETIDIVGQIQVDGLDATNGLPSRYGILFQKPCPARPFAGWRAFGHDGAAGALGFADPDCGLAFGFTTNRPAPAGGDRRADELAAMVRDIAVSSRG